MDRYYFFLLYSIIAYSISIYLIIIINIYLYLYNDISNDIPYSFPTFTQHITGLGHVADLATAMAQVIGKEKAKGQIYNIQDVQSVTFESLTKLCAQAMGSDFDSTKLDIKLYQPKLFDFGDKKAFPMREQHFFCSGYVFIFIRYNKCLFMYT